MADLLPDSTVGGQQILTEGSEIKQGPRGAGAEPWHVTLYTADGQPVQVPIPVTLTGQIRGLASERPAPSSENKDVVYWSTDTGDVSVSTGTMWRHMGMA